MRVRRKRALDEVLVDKLGLPHGVMDIMRQIVEADEQIRLAVERWPDKAERLNSSFRMLMPSALLRGRVEDVYRAHVAELLERLALGQDTRPGTKAEVLCAMLDSSLIAPPGDDYGRLVEVLFHEVMPGRLDAGRTHEQWAGQHAEMLVEYRRALAQADRRG